MIDNVVKVAEHGPVMTIMLNRPAKRNAIDGRVARGVATALDRLDVDDNLRVAILHGADSTFSAGADLKAIAAGESNAVPGRGFAGIVAAPPVKPVIASVEGWVLGGGFEVILACGLVVAAQNARFGLPEVRRGLVARGGGAFRLPQRVPRAVPLEILMTGEPITAGRGYELGLVNRVVPDGTTLDSALGLAVIAANAPLSVVASKRVADQSRSWPDGEAFAWQRAHIDPVFASADAGEGATAFTEHRNPVWSGR